MLKNHVLKNTYFIPMKLMREVIDSLESSKYVGKKHPCDHNIASLQRQRNNTFSYSVFASNNWLTMFNLACHKALYAHDWDKLLYLLKKFPRWKFNIQYLIFEAIYTRHLLLLLMYHPTSQAQGLLCEYLHMTWGCRSDQDKKAMLKVLLMLPRKLPKPVGLVKKKGVPVMDVDSD